MANQKVNILETRPAHSSAPSQRQMHAQKRALPPRHSFLSEAVEIALQKQCAPNGPQIDHHSILCVTDDVKEKTHCIEKEQEQGLSIPEVDLSVVPKAVFTAYSRPPRRRRLVSNVPIIQVEPVLEEYYLRRHRKHEKEEKKQKNREKEKLQHEMYQQQQFVDRIRHTDKSMVLAIAATLWQQQEEGKKRTPMPSADALYRQVLQDAEDQLARYEMLGLSVSGTRKQQQQQQRTHTHDSPPPPHQHPSPPEASSVPSEPVIPSSMSSPPVALPPPPPMASSSSSSSSSASSVSLSTTTTTTTTTAAAVLARLPVDTGAASRQPNKKHATPSAFTFNGTGRTRRSTRSALAFGHKLPVMKVSEFQLPYEEFGQLMERRAKAAQVTGLSSAVRTRRRATGDNNRLGM